MGEPVKHRRIKLKYNPAPNANERAHHIAVMAKGCLVCQRDAIAHHILQDSPSKRWRRDHQLVVPLCDDCHTGLHRNGSEIAWQAAFGLDLAREAEFLRTESIMAGVL